MTDDFRIDARKWRFLDDPAKYVALDKAKKARLQIEPLKRQFKTAKEILSRLARGRGALLADDVGLGKTTIAALVAWVVACQDKRVRIYAPNEVLQRRWAEELERHVTMLRQIGASNDRIKQGDVGKLKAGRIQVTSHYTLVKHHKIGAQRVGCDLMIIDEAHRAKGEGSAFNEALRSLGGLAARKLILTATPFSINLSELEELLDFVGASDFDAVRAYAKALERLYTLGEGHDAEAEAERLVSSARAAIEALQPFVIRHGIEDLSSAERKHFGAAASDAWEITTPAASPQDLSLLLRMDRLLQLAPERNGERRNDPRFHVGWQHMRSELERVVRRARGADDPALAKHIQAARKALDARRGHSHPKVKAVGDAVRALADEGEKVLIFCHHRATASELLGALEHALRSEIRKAGPPEAVWRQAWNAVLPIEDELGAPIIDWLCSEGLRRQVSGWLGAPARNAKALTEQLATTRPRNSTHVSLTIVGAAQSLTETLLDRESGSTRALLRAIVKDRRAFSGSASRFPGRLDDGLRTMGSWPVAAHAERPKTLYTGKPDVVLAIFNSPFGPDVLVATDRLSEGVDLHRCCRHLIHYELDPSPLRTLQRNGRVRRVGSWAATTKQPIRYAYPTFGGTRDEKAVAIMKQRINAFGLLLGGVPELSDRSDDRNPAEDVLLIAGRKLQSLNARLTV